MIRFRLGQTWKRERTSPAVDAFGLELEGVDVLAQASEESLEQVVSELVEAVHGLSSRGERLGQISLPEAHLELCLLRQGTQLELSVVALVRPARVIRRLELELGELREAVARCARGLIRDLGEQLPDGARRLDRQLSRKLSALEHGPLVPDPRSDDPGFSYRASAEGLCAFGFSLWDSQDRIRAFHSRRSGALSSLLCEGEVWLRVDGATRWALKAPPWLIATELSRQAAELANAVAENQAPASVRLGPEGTSVPLSAEGPSSAASVARAMCELGLAVAFAMTSRHRSQARNPYVMDVSERAREALAHLREAEKPEAGGVARADRPSAPSKPLDAAGRLRRLKFHPLWVKQNLGGETPGNLLVGPRGPVFGSPEMACGFTRAGELLFRRIAPNGVATDGAGHVLTATADRVLGFVGAGSSARWLRDHDGISLGPSLWAREGRWLTVSEGRAVLAFDEQTGRELWRLAPPKTQRCHLSVQAHRALVSTDAGLLYGLDLDDGQVRYRMRASLPFLGPMVAWGRRSLGALGQGDAGAIFAVDAHRGAVVWAHELPMPLASAPLAARNRVLFAAAPGTEGVLICLTSKGERAWERPLRMGPGPYCLSPAGRGVIVSSRSGAAALLDSDGQELWRVGAAGEALARGLAPQKSRGVLLVPGTTVRAIDPATGEILGEVSAGTGLCALVTDTRLNLYLLDEVGTLRAFRLGTYLSVVGE